MLILAMWAACPGCCVTPGKTEPSLNLHLPIRQDAFFLESLLAQNPIISCAVFY